MENPRAAVLHNVWDHRAYHDVYNAGQIQLLKRLYQKR